MSQIFTTGNFREEPYTAEALKCLDKKYGKMGKPKILKHLNKVFLLKQIKNLKIKKNLGNRIFLLRMFEASLLAPICTRG